MWIISLLVVLIASMSFILALAMSIVRYLFEESFRP